MLLAAANHGFTVLFVLMGFLAISVWMGTMAQRALDKKKFLEGFFLGNRGLGAWALALTATVQSGGTFMGYPALVYSYGWVGLLWIAPYMVVPLTGFAMIGKRLSQLSRRTGAITVPDMFRARFNSPAVGLTASLLIMFFLSFTMFAQFKAGATVMKLAWPGSGAFTFAEDATVTVDYGYYIGLAVFSITVVGYTMIGGFLASVWTDLFQSLLMVVGVIALLCLALPAAGGLEQATRTAITQTGPEFALGPGYSQTGQEFLTAGLAGSMFFLWIFSGFSSPASMIRVMAASNTEVIRKSIALLSCYNCLIYIPLAVIAVCGRALFPTVKPDEIIPTLALQLTGEMTGGSGVASLILAAPFGAIMASVSCFVLVIASALVQDIYLQFIHPRANPREIRLATNVSMVLVGVIGVAAVIYPPTYLQALVVFSASAGAVAFLTPVLMACYWRRATATGALAAMIGGIAVYLTLYITGWVHNWADAAGDGATGFAVTVQQFLGPVSKQGIAGALRPYFLLGIDPICWGLAASAVIGIGVSLLTRPLDEAHLRRVYDGTPVSAI